MIGKYPDRNDFPVRILRELGEKPVILGAALALIAILLYMPAVHHEFLVVDDSAYVTNNVHVNTGLHLNGIVWAFTDFSTFYWHPVTWISHMVDCQIFGLNPGAHHLTNIVLHAINVFLLFMLLQWATGAVWRSFLVAALFAVHPMNVETVAWVAERKSLLSALFSLLTIAAYGWYARRPGWKRYLIIVVTFAFALASKSMAVTLPIVLLLLDYWPLGRDEGTGGLIRWSRLFVEKLPLFLLSAASSLITVVGQRSAGAVASFSELPVHLRIENAIITYAVYLGKLVWPVNLAVFYPHPASKLPYGSNLPWGPVIACSAVLLVISWATVRFRGRRYLVAGWFAYLIVIFPISGIVQAGMQAMADRFVYLPYVGLFIIIVWSIGDLMKGAPIAWLRGAAILVAACALLAYALVAGRYLAYWQNGITLMEHARTVAGEPDAMIESLLADAYYFAGQPAKAVPHYRMWCQLVPAYDLCHYNLAQVLYQLGELREAFNEYQAAGRLTRNPEIALDCARKSREVLAKLGH